MGLRVSHAVRNVVRKVGIEGLSPAAVAEEMGLEAHEVAAILPDRDALAGHAIEAMGDQLDLLDERASELMHQAIDLARRAGEGIGDQASAVGSAVTQLVSGGLGLLGAVRLDHQAATIVCLSSLGHALAHWPL